MDRLIGEISASIIDLRDMQNQLDAELHAVRENFEGRIAAKQDAINARLQVAQAWAEANPEEFGKRKSIDFTSGVAGFRTGTHKLKTLSGFTWARVLEKLEVILPAYVRKKNEPDKDRLIADRESLGEAQLKKVGLVVVQDESFYVEPKLTELVERVTAAA